MRVIVDPYPYTALILYKTLYSDQLQPPLSMDEVTLYRNKHFSQDINLIEVAAIAL